MDTQIETQRETSVRSRPVKDSPWTFEFKNYSTVLALLVLFIILGVMTEGGFLEARNFTNLTRQISVNGILALGMTLVILTGGIDLSVGSMVALTGIVMGLLQVNANWGSWGWTGNFLTVAVGLFAGFLGGAINGGLISFFRIPPFIITLGMMVVARGIALIFSNSSAISPMSDGFTWFAKGFIPAEGTLLIFSLLAVPWLLHCKKRWTFSWTYFLGIFLEGLCLFFPAWAFTTDRGMPFPAFLFLLTAGGLLFLLKDFPLGRYIYAIGGNEEAAYFAGVPVKKVKWIVYALMGTLAGLSGMILTARLNSATPTEGNLMELDAIAAVVIGGTSLSGGQGALLGSVLGAFLIGTVNNGMDLMGIDSNFQMVVKGLIIVFAVWTDARAKQKA